MDMPPILCVIPSRIGSTRLPRKPLLPLAGKPMVQWVYTHARACTAFSRVVVATDDPQIEDVISQFGGEVIRTDPALRTGSDRVAAVATQLPQYPIVVNLQGDEPFIRPAMLEALVAPYRQPLAHVASFPDSCTLARLIHPGDPDYHSPHMVKVVRRLDGYALYFSRSPIPFFRENTSQPVYHHKGLYAFQREVLLAFTQLEQTPLEQTEMLEQLRLLENGYNMYVSLTTEPSLEINTSAEYEAALAIAPQYL